MEITCAQWYSIFIHTCIPFANNWLWRIFCYFHFFSLLTALSCPVYDISLIIRSDDKNSRIFWQGQRKSAVWRCAACGFFLLANRNIGRSGAGTRISPALSTAVLIALCAIVDRLILRKRDALDISLACWLNATTLMQ